MEDLIPVTQENLIPAAVENERYSKEHSNYMSTITAGALSTFPGGEQAVEDINRFPVVESKVHEDQIRHSLASQEKAEDVATWRTFLVDQVIQGATPEQVALLREHKSKLMHPDRSVLERRAAKFLIETGFKKPERAVVVAKEESEFPDFTKTDKQEEFLSTMLRINTLRSKLHEKFKNENVAENAIDFTSLLLVPGYTTLSEGKVFGRDAVTLGNSVSKAVEGFWSLPLAERMNRLDAFEKDLESNAIVGSNTLQAIQQVEQLLTHKHEDEWLLDLTEVLDASVVGIPFARVIKAMSSISSLSKLAGAADLAKQQALALRSKSALSAAEEDELITNAFPFSTGKHKAKAEFGQTPSPNKVTEGFAGEKTTGQITGSIEQKFPSDVSHSIEMMSSSGKGTASFGKTLEGNPTIADVSSSFGPVSFELKQAELGNQFNELLPGLLKMAEKVAPNSEINQATELLEVLKDNIFPEILRSNEQSTANTEAIKILLRDHKIPVETRAIIDPETVTGRKVFDGLHPVYDVEIENLTGIRTVSLYLGHGDKKLDPFISPLAAKYGARNMGLDPSVYSIVEKDGGFFLKVTKDSTTLNMISPIDVKETKWVFPVLGKYIQGMKTILSEDALEQAALVVSESSRMKQAVSTATKKITTLSPQSRKGYDLLMYELQQKEKWMQLGEINDWYKKNFGRLPTQKEVDAYVATRQLYEFDYVIRDATRRTELVTRGYEEVLLKGIFKDTRVGKIVDTTSVSPRISSIFDSSTGKVTLYKNKDDLTKRLHDKDNPGVLVKVLDAPADYYITHPSDVQTKALRHGVLNKIDGPHRIYDTGVSGGYIKQQRIVNRFGQEVVVNPKTHFAISSEKEGIEWAEKYNKALDAYHQAKSGKGSFDQIAATKVINENTRFSNFEQFDKAVKEGRILDTPFEFVKPGALPAHRMDKLAEFKILDPDFSGLSDGLLSDIEAGRLFYSKRGKRLPHPKEGLAPLLHPNEIMSIAITNVINTQSYRNFKVRQIERWVRTYGKHLDGYDPNRPAIEMFMSGQWDKSPNPKYPLDDVIRRSAEAQRESIKGFLNTPGVLEYEASRFRENAINIIENKVGTSVARKLDDITSRNATGFARGAAFHAMLGMGDMSQAIVQMSMLPAISVINPKWGVHGLLMYPMQRAALLNPAHDAYIGSLYKKMTFGKSIDEKTFALLMKDLRKSGIDIVDANIAEIDNLSNSSNLRGLVGHYTGKAFDTATFFFKEGEKSSRLLGWNVAWLEHYEKTKRGIETAEEFGHIIRRADALAGNMRKDGKAWWQNGWLSVGTQFAAHPMRVTELMIHPGAGLSVPERLRYYTASALMYGGLLGAGGGVFEYFRQKYFEATGKEPDMTTWNTFRNGLTGALFPETDISRMQPYGQDFLLQKFFDPNSGENFTKFLGPAGSLGNDFVDATIGSAKVWALATGGFPLNETPGVLLDIAHDVAKSISSYDRLDKAIHVAQEGIYFSKKGQPLVQDLNQHDAVNVLLGFPPRQSREAFEARAFLSEYNNKIEKDAQKAASEYLTAWRLFNKGDEEGGYRHLKYVQYLADLHNKADLSGTGAVQFAKRFDQEVAKTGAHNMQVFQMYQRVLGRTREDLMTGKK